MKIFRTSKKLAWGGLDIPLMALEKDWHQIPMAEPSVFSLAQDPDCLWFVSIFQKNSISHPGSKPQAFTAELWKYDVAELFISNPATGEYLEFNLAPNAAWWACKFRDERQAAEVQPDHVKFIRTHGDGSSAENTVVAMEIPLILLETEIQFAADSKVNITFIRNTPQHRYLSASILPGVEPNFHQPHHFSSITYLPTTHH